MEFKKGDVVITIKDFAFNTVPIGKPKLGLKLVVDSQDGEVVTMSNKDEYHIEEIRLQNETELLEDSIV